MENILEEDIINVDEGDIMLWKDELEVTLEESVEVVKYSNIVELACAATKAHYMARLRSSVIFAMSSER